MNVVWSRASGRDRDAIFDRIAGDNFSAAAENDSRIAAIERQLVAFPESGRVGRVPATRELVVTGTPYIAIYLVETDRITILRVIHGAQDWPIRDRN